jgi:hypothetical protein
MATYQARKTWLPRTAGLLAPGNSMPCDIAREQHAALHNGDQSSTLRYIMGRNLSEEQIPVKLDDGCSHYKAWSLPSEESMRPGSLIATCKRWEKLLLLSLLEKWCSSCVWNSFVFSELVHIVSGFVCVVTVCPFFRWWKTKDIHVDLAWLVWGPTVLRV